MALHLESVDRIELNRAISRLGAKLFTSHPSPALLSSASERAKTAANIEYARQLLLRQEHVLPSIKNASQRHKLHEALEAHRTTLKRLTGRLHELSDQSNRTGFSENMKNEITITVDQDLIDSEEDADESQPTTDSSKDLAREEAAFQEAEKEAIDKLSGSAFQSSGIRNRHGRGDETATSPSMAKPTQAEKDSSVQADLTTSLLSLAQQLSSSSKALSASLALDTKELDLASNALQKNADGLDVATSRMGTLQKMGEGRWWGGRMMLYGIIFALWVTLFLLVFVGPKLRF